MKKIGIVTSARELNYGAILQAYALQTVINKLGYDTCLLWWKNQQASHRDIRIKKLFAMMLKYVLNPSIARKSIKAYRHTFDKEITSKSIDFFQNFEDEYLDIKFLTYHQMKKYAGMSDCKAIIAGSDQIWNSYAIYVDPFYYLRFAKMSKRIAYAPSLGKNDIPEYNKKAMKKYITEFHNLSVRENSGRRLIKSLINEDVPVVADPTFLLTIREWKKIEKDMDIPSEYVLLYFLDKPNQECMCTIKKIVEREGLSILALPYLIWDKSFLSDVSYVDAGPSQFVTLIDKASLVLTDSFHGTVFSLIFNKHFITFDRQYGNNQSQASRITDLLALFKLSDHFISENTDETEIRGVDYLLVNEEIEKYKEISLNYLIEAIESCGNKL